jgi:hypothetical protein
MQEVAGSKPNGDIAFFGGDGPFYIVIEKRRYIIESLKKYALHWVTNDHYLLLTNMTIKSGCKLSFIYKLCILLTKSSNLREHHAFDSSHTNIQQP